MSEAPTPPVADPTAGQQAGAQQAATPATPTPPPAPKQIELPAKEYVTHVVPMAELLSSSPEDENAQLTPTVGDVVTGIVVSVERGRILVDLGNVSTAVITGQELDDTLNTAATIQPGDEIEAVVISAENEEGQVVLSLRRASQEKAWQAYQEAYEKGETMTVEIGEANKGGLLMELDGIRGFIPVSQLTPEHYPRVSGADPEKILARLSTLVGMQLTVKIISIDPDEKRMILSEKAAYMKEREKILKTLTVGDIVDGRVSGVVNFGIFVNYSGVEGLVHISELAWGHVGDPNDVARIGDDVKVKIIGLEGDKVSFSIKRLSPDPWIQAVGKLKEGQVVEGEVARFAPFGVFVRLTPEVDGLVHNSELGFPEGTDPQSVLEPGQKVNARIKSINLEEHRVDLSLKLAPSSEDSAPKRSSVKRPATKSKKDEEELEKKPAKKGKRVRIEDDEDELP